ncbi:uncharacterized protein LOC119081604 [Bradysia coprophila]|uniref:uncharacterized protein LOC119081604 n=1 Tax=Bradysia coprophila TaxID=38358 RepID=UPI00187DAB94|nr:uncharacterized protein LOC119081604 [Bradysia coprophila]
MAPTLQSTDISTNTVTEVQADGSILKTITITTTTKFTDGTTRQRIKTQKEITPAVHTSHTGVKAIKANPYEFGYDVSKSTAPKAVVTTSNEFIQQCLDEHNKFRAMHHAPPLKLNNKLSKIAQAWANQLAKDEKMYHSETDFGENLFLVYSRQTWILCG